MELRQIRDFIEVAKAGSFAAASKKLRISQAGLGYQIRQLELDLGVQLLTRHSRGVTLTPSGQAFLMHAEKGLAVLADARQSATHAAEAARTRLKIGLSPTTMQILSPSLLAAALDAGSGIEVSLHPATSGALQYALEAGEIDVAFALTLGESSLLRKALYRERLYLIGRPDTPSADLTVQFSQLADLQLVGGPVGHVVRDRLDATAAMHGIRLDVVQDIVPGNLRRSLLLHNGCHTVAPFGVFLDDIKSGLLTARLVVEPELPFDVEMMQVRPLPARIERILLDAVHKAVLAQHGVCDWIDDGVVPAAG